MDILVIGCGVNGLTTGLSLLEAGHSLQIWAKELPPDTTSNRAAAIWYPYKATAPNVSQWGTKGYETFKLLRHVQESGVLWTNMLEVKSEASADDPWWATIVDGFRHARPEELSAGYADGYVFEVPVIDTSIYLDYLLRRFQAQGGRIQQRAISDLSQAFAQSAIVVNCSGLGARELVGDRDLYPSRGQVIRVRHNGFRTVLLDHDKPNEVTYIVPRTNDIVLGGSDEEHNESTAINVGQTRDILRRCAKLAPQFANITSEDIVSVACGLRPVRSTVRVEAERIAPERLLIHNYGHGGAGITLSWGCAAEVMELVSQESGTR